VNLMSQIEGQRDSRIRWNSAWASMPAIALRGGAEGSEGELGPGLDGDYGIGVPSRQAAAGRARYRDADRRGGIRQVRDPGGFDVEMLAPVGHVAARPQRPDDLDGLAEHFVSHSGQRPLPADDVLVEILARAEAEGEPAVGEQLHGGRLLRDDGGVITADRAGDVRHQGNAVGS